MIVQRVTSNSAMVCGVFIPRPPSMPSADWQDFWRTARDWNGSDSIAGRLKTLVNFDAFRAMVFGAVIPKAPTVTQTEWEVFWQARSSRPSLNATNHFADQAYRNYRSADQAYRNDRPRTARKPVR